MKTIFKKQSGATLVIALITMALLAILAIYGVGISVMDQRSSANEFRAKEALLAAESGIEQAIGHLNLNRKQIGSWTWSDCAGTDTDPPCGVIPAADRANWKYRTVPPAQTVQPANGDFEVHLLTPDSGDNKHLLFNIVSVGDSEDGTAQRVARQATYFFPLIVKIADSPMISAGDIGFSGNFSVVTNPNGGGTGVPLTAWSKSDITITGSPSTCQLDEFLSTGSAYDTQTDGNGNTITMCASCTCPTSGALSKNGVEGIDILDIDGNTGANKDTTNFPPDMFEYIFGVKTADYAEVKKEATVIANCDGLNTSSSGLYWVTGNCQPAGDVGSFAGPVTVIVEGDSKINSNNYFFGMMFAFSTNPAATLNLDLNGTPTFYGAIMTNAKISLSNGNYKMRFDVNVLKNMSLNPGARGLAKIPGSWADY